MRKHVLIARLQQGKMQTLGKLIVFNGLKAVYNCKTLELPDRGNQRNISRIPAGDYRCRLRVSDRHGTHYEILDVPNRSYILMHSGNWYTHTEGCVLLGRKFHDLNNDGLLDVTSSRNTMLEFLEVMPHEFDLKIIDIEH